MTFTPLPPTSKIMRRLQAYRLGTYTLLLPTHLQIRVIDVIEIRTFFFFLFPWRHLFIRSVVRLIFYICKTGLRRSRTRRSRNTRKIKIKYNHRHMGTTVCIHYTAYGRKSYVTVKFIYPFYYIRIDIIMQSDVYKLWKKTYTKLYCRNSLPLASNLFYNVQNAVFFVFFRYWVERENY